jgi:GAF domain-containing protein
MSASYTSRASSQADAPSLPRPVDTRYLYRIINTVGSTLDLDRVLRAVVDLVTEAVDCHACFIYFVDPTDKAVVLRAVSEPYTRLVGRLRFEHGEGLAGWVAEHGTPVFLADSALTDPRVKVVPEAEEDKYQSLVAVPLWGKAGEVIGVIALHAVAPREFTQEDSDFLTTSASLVAGAIENARLYEHTRLRLTLVEGLAELARTIAAAPTLDQLLPAVVRRAHRLLRAEACQILLADGATAALSLGASWPQDAPAPRHVTANELGVELARRSGGDRGAVRLAGMLWGSEQPASALVLPLVAADELVGFMALRLEEQRRIVPGEREIAASIAGQLAVAVKKVELIDRLQEHNAIKDFLEDLAHGNASAGELHDRGRALGCDLDRPHLVLQAVPRPGANPRPWDEVAAALESAATRTFPGSLLDRRDGAVRGLVHLGPLTEKAAVARLREIHQGVNQKHAVAIGLSHRCEGAASFPTGFEEAEHAVVAASVVSSEPSVISFDDLGAYKYLLRVSQDGRVRDPRGDALKTLHAYDQRHRSQLLLTLEEYLKRRGNIAAAAATLYVHPNTLRQRLRRIQDLTGLDVANEDWLMIEIELKLLRLEAALGRG